MQALHPSSSAPAVALSSSPLYHLEEGERRRFAFFQVETVGRLGGYFEDDIWRGLVLQLATSEAPIRQMSIAFGLIHEQFEHSRSGSTSICSTDPPRDATHPYHKAVCHLQTHIEREGWAKLEVTLVACLLCVGFEWMRGGSAAASIHLGAGLSILKQWYFNNKNLPESPGFWSPTGLLIQQKIIPFYNRLVLQSASLYDFSLRWEHLPTAQTALDTFQTLDHARDSLVELIGQVHLNPERRALLKDGSAAACWEHVRCQTALATWKVYFDDYLARRHLDKMSTPSVNTIRMIKLLYTVSTIMLDNIAFDDRALDERQTVAFGEVVDGASEILQSDGSARFAIDLGLVPLVYYVAIHCRNTTTPQRALDLLSSHRLQEGYWRSDDALRNAHDKLMQRRVQGNYVLGFKSADTTR